MNKQEIKEFIDQNVRYKDWQFYVGDKNGTIYLQIKFLAPNNLHPEKIEWQHCRKWQLSEFMTPTELVQTCWAAVTRAEMHEISEQFKYKNQAIFDTHIKVDTLAEICGAEICGAGNHEHRGDPV